MKILKMILLSISLYVGIILLILIFLKKATENDKEV